jgi:hypothetical protein
MGDNAVVSPTQRRRLPREAVAPGLAIDDGGKRIRRERSVLLLAELPIFQRIRMKERGALITRVQDVAEAVRALAADTFDAAIVDMKAPGGGTRLVTCLKGGVGSTEPLAHLVETEMAAVCSEPDSRLDRAVDDATQGAAAAIGARLAGISELEQRARERHRLTPFFLVMEGEQQYAIVVDPPEHSYLEDGKGLSLPDAVMCLDIGKLLLRGSALA